MADTALKHSIGRLVCSVFGVWRIDISQHKPQPDNAHEETRSRNPNKKQKRLQPALGYTPGTSQHRTKQVAFQIYIIALREMCLWHGS